MRFESLKNWIEAYITAGWMDERVFASLNKVDDRNRMNELAEMVAQYLDGVPSVSERAESIKKILDAKTNYLDLVEEMQKELKD